MKTEEIARPKDLDWFEADPDAPVVGVKQYGQKQVMYRFSWEAWPVTQAALPAGVGPARIWFDLQRGGVITLLLVEVPLVAVDKDGMVRLTVNQTVELLVAPLRLLPRRRRRVILFDSRGALRVGLDSEAVASLAVSLPMLKECVVWIGTQRAHVLF